MSASFVDRQIAEIREFNRFYTARLGLLRKRHLDGEFSLTEARILYEIGANPHITAAGLCGVLALDPGYVSRLLSALARRKFVRQLASTADARQRLLTLTPAGIVALARLNAQSDTQIDSMLSHLNTADRERLVAAVMEARRILAILPAQDVQIVRLTDASAEALDLLEEYYEAVHVVKRDPPGALQNLISELNSAMWLAYIGNKVIGCVVLRNLFSIPHAGECKRLYVRPSARGRSVATLLLDALEEHARSLRMEWIYLDTYDDLRPAIALYERRGYQRCERYNDNPQATLFMRKRL